MLDDSAINALIGDMLTLHLSERGYLDMLHQYVKGERGAPSVPEGAEEEIKQIARLSIKNVLGVIRDTFAQNLSVVGYRNAMATNNAPAWGMWQRNKMDARQREVYKPAVTYGAAYVAVMPGKKGPVFRPCSPRQLFAVYTDPRLDDWPQYALETWIDETDAKPRRKGLFYDNECLYPLDLGAIPSPPGRDPDRNQPVSVQVFGEPVEHGATDDGDPVCPVIRFVNDRDADDMIVGEIAPLIGDQRAINEVNFDRLIVSRFGAFPQKVISGWSGTKSEVLQASARRVWTFEDDVKAWTLPPATVDGYNSVLDEMMAFVAMKARISPAQVVGKLVNLSSDTLAAAEAQEQRKLVFLRESFGESWEQTLRVGAAMDGDAATAADLGAEVVWRDTEARSFGAVVDGVTKLVQVGVPIGAVLSMIPGMTQQQIQSIKEELQTQQQTQHVTGLVNQLRAAAGTAAQNPTVAALASQTAPVAGGGDGGVSVADAS